MNTGEIQSPLRVNKMFQKKKKIYIGRPTINSMMPHSWDLPITTAKRLDSL